MSSKKITQEAFDALQQGDCTVFEEIFHTNYYKVKSFIKKIIKSEIDAEELTQEVFINLWNNKANINSVNTFYGYLFNLAKYCSFKYIDKKNNRIICSFDDTPIKDIASDPESDYDALELSQLYTNEIERMPPQRKKIFKMSRMEEMSNDEIAQKLNISKRTVETHIHVALKQLRKVTYITLLFITLFY